MPPFPPSFPSFRLQFFVKRLVASCTSTDSSTIASFHKWGKLGIISEMEAAWMSICTASPDALTIAACDESRVKYYLQSDLLSKASCIIQAYPFNRQMQAELLGFHLRSQCHPKKADECLNAAIGMKSCSLEVLEVCIGHLLENDKFLQAQKLFNAYFSVTEAINCQSLPFIKAFMRYFHRKRLFAEAAELEAQVAASKAPLDLEWWNLLLAGYALQGNLAKMHQIAGKISGNSMHLESNISTYNAFLAYYAMHEPNEEVILNKCAELLHQIHSKKLAFDEWTCGILVDKMIRFSNYTQMTALFQQLKNSQTFISPEAIHSLSVKFAKNSLDFALGLLFDWCEHFKVQVGMRTRNLWIDYLLSRHEFHAALRELAKASFQGCQLNSETFRVLLHHYSANFQIEGCRVLLEEMHLLGIEMTNAHHEACMSCFYFVADEAVNPTLIRTVPELLKEENCIETNEPTVTESSSDSPIDTSNASTIASSPIAFRQLNRNESIPMHELSNLYQRIFHLPTPPPITINVCNELLLNALRHRRLSEFGMLYDRVACFSSLSPNILSYMLKIKALILAHEDQAARKVLLEMQQMNLQPPMLAYAYIFHYYCRKADTDSAEQLLAEFEQSKNFRINFVFYASLLYAYVKQNNFLKVLSTFNRLEAKYMISDTETFNYVIESHFRTGQPREATAYFERMREQQIPRNWYTYSILIDNLLRLEGQSFQGGSEGEGGEFPSISFIYQEILPDCTLKGNCISAASFDRLFLYHFHRGNIHAIEELVLLMINFSVRFDQSCIAFLAVALKNFIAKDAYEKAVALLWKCCTDFAPLNPNVEELISRAAAQIEQKMSNGKDEEEEGILEAIALLKEAYAKGDLMEGPANSLISTGFWVRGQEEQQRESSEEEIE